MVAAGGLLARQGQRGVDKGQYFARFGHKNVEHLRIDIGHCRRGIHAGRRGGRQGLVEQGHRHGAGGGDFFKWQRAEGAGGGIEVETPAGRLRVAAQHIDKKSQRADILRDLVKRPGVRLRLGVRVGVASGQLPHGRIDLQHGGAGVFLSQPRQLLLQLFQHGGDAIEGPRRPRTRCIRVIRIEHLFHLAQAGLHVLGQRGDGLALLDLARQLARRDGRRRFASEQRLQARGDGFRIAGEIVGQAAHLLQPRVGKQQRHADFILQRRTAPAGHG